MEKNVFFLSNGGGGHIELNPTVPQLVGEFLKNPFSVILSVLYSLKKNLSGKLTHHCPYW